MRLDPDRRGATMGTLAGVVVTEELVEVFRSVFQSFGAGCDDPEDLMATIRGASDILEDGSQDPSALCNAISVGLGFDAEAVTIGAFEEPSWESEDWCH